MLQEIAAIDRVVEVQPFVVALLPRQVVDTVDAALCANYAARSGELMMPTSQPNSASLSPGPCPPNRPR
jgi:hypothetical protein